MNTSDHQPPGARVINRPDAVTMRAVLGHFCTGVAVITGHDGARPYGFACQSVTSVSLDPPYVSFCPAHTSSSWPLIRTVGRVCINVLAVGQRTVCATFATSGVDKFAEVSWAPGDNGAPVLDGALASIEADVEFEHGAGDHTIVVARVTGLHAHEGRRPLLFYRGGYGGIELHD
ncbi:flavin reductase family protein [Mycolicibacterium hippocampi]|uniref:flavin reductase family protein n=1 Tax=Mycolicibacterium hippocampi TaxID=659824 RepID=UPI0035139ABE